MQGVVDSSDHLGMILGIWMIVKSKKDGIVLPFESFEKTGIWGLVEI